MTKKTAFATFVAGTLLGALGGKPLLDSLEAQADPALRLNRIAFFRAQADAGETWAVEVCGAVYAHPDAGTPAYGGCVSRVPPKTWQARIDDLATAGEAAWWAGQVDGGE